MSDGLICKIWEIGRFSDNFTVPSLKLRHVSPIFGFQQDDRGMYNE
jgi:hypothetical protein